MTQKPDATDSQALISLGWDDRWRALSTPHLDGDRVAARVLRSDRGSFLVETSEGLRRAKPSVRLQKHSEHAVDLPVVGDWVILNARGDLEFPQIDRVLDRKSAILRGDPGKASSMQILAANVDLVFIVHPIDQAPNLRRIERELSLAWDSSASPIVVLTKADLSPDPVDSEAAVISIAPGVDVLLVNSLDGDSVSQLRPYIDGYRTAVLLGPSGAGKTTIVNSILGEERLETQEVRKSDGRGRHTTVARELVRVPGNGIIIDTPGLRALGLTGSEAGISATFPDIEALSLDCRFRDCGHRHEPGCAVLAAVESGSLEEGRLLSFRKLRLESQYVARKNDAALRAEEEKKWKAISKEAKKLRSHDKRNRSR